LRFFLENTDRSIDAALCLEGMELGRLSYSSLGMARGEIEVTAMGEAGESGVVAALAGLVRSLLDIHAREEPARHSGIGSVEAVGDDGVLPRGGLRRFGIRSENAGRVARVVEGIAGLVASRSAEGAGQGIEARLGIIAHRRPGDLGEGHPLV